MSRKTTPDLDKVMNDIATLKEGCDLLEQVWRALGPYGISEAILALKKEGRLDPRVKLNLGNQIQSYFDFDDSE